MKDQGLEAGDWESRLQCRLKRTTRENIMIRRRRRLKKDPLPRICLRKRGRRTQKVEGLDSDLGKSWAC
jgi:hypothetical protein